MTEQVAQDTPETTPREPETVTFRVGRYLWSGLLFTVLSTDPVKVRSDVDLIVALPPDTYCFIYNHYEVQDWNNHTDIVEFAKQYQRREHSTTSLRGLTDADEQRVVLHTLFDGIPF